MQSFCLPFAQVTSNRSLDGVLDILNSKNVTDAGPLQLIDHEEKVSTCAGRGRGGTADGGIRGMERDQEKEVQ